MDNGNGDDCRVLDWEIGLPSADDITPLSQLLVPPYLASAFSISPEPSPTNLDVHRASQTTLSSLRRHNSDSSSSSSSSSLSPDESKIPQSEAARNSKRPRLAWTPQLHKRFVEVVAYIGIKNAVPKTIMEMMNVEGLTRENVASHLQKYRLFLKRMEGNSDDDLQPSDPMPAQQAAAMPYVVPTMIPMPMYRMTNHHQHQHHQHHHNHHQFGGFREQRSKDWRNGSKFGNSVASYPHSVTPNDK